MAFERVEDSYEFMYREDGHPISAWNITVCRGYRGFPLQFRENRPNY